MPRMSVTPGGRGLSEGSSRERTSRITAGENSGSNPCLRIAASAAANSVCDCSCAVTRASGAFAAARGEVVTVVRDLVVRERGYAEELRVAGQCVHGVELV